MFNKINVDNIYVAGDNIIFFCFLVYVILEGSKVGVVINKELIIEDLVY